MSILVTKPAGTAIDQFTFDKCVNIGQNMLGFSYAKDGKVLIRKNLKNKEKFFEEITKLKDYSAIIHFASKPTFEHINYCGPYRLDENHTMIHAGTVWNFKDLSKKDHSQSLNLLIEIKKFWEPSFFGKDYLKYLIEKALPVGNRLVIINNLGETQKFSDSAGLDYKNCWFSTFFNTYNNYGTGHGVNYSSPVYGTGSTGSNISGEICSFCKAKFYGGQIKKGTSGWICYKCESSISEYRDKICDKAGQKNSIIVKHDFKETAESPASSICANLKSPDTQKKTGFLEELAQTSKLDTSFLEVFAVI